MAVTLSTTNCFVQTLTGANTYFANLYHRATAWAALSDDAKSQLLIQATSMLLAYVTWIDEPDLTDPEDEQITACYELAWCLKDSDLQAERDDKGIASIGLGDVNVNFAKGDARGLIPAHVLRIVKDLMSGISGSVAVTLERH